MMGSNVPSQIEAQIEDFLEHFRNAHSVYLDRQETDLLDVMESSTDSMTQLRGGHTEVTHKVSREIVGHTDMIELTGDDMNSYIATGIATGNRLSLPTLLHLTSQEASTSPSSDYMSSTSSFNSLEDPTTPDGPSNGLPRCKQTDIEHTDKGITYNTEQSDTRTEQSDTHTTQTVDTHSQHQTGLLTLSNLERHQTLSTGGSARSSLCESDYKSLRSVYSEAELQSLRSSYWSLYGSLGSLVAPTKDYVMGESSCQLTILDVADVLQAKYAFVSGGKGPDGASILTFPDVHSLPELTDEQYSNLVTYLLSIPSLQDADAGFSVVIDRRKDKWSAVKSILNKIKTYFPGTLSTVYVVKPAGFLQKTFGNIGKDNLKDSYTFKISMCTGLEDLHKQLTTSQLTSDLGGTLIYDHKDWVNHRAAVEKFSANTTRLGDNLRHWCEKLQLLEFPNDVESTNKLIREHEQAHHEISDDLESTLKHGDILLKCFKTVHDPDGQEQEIDTAKLPVCKLVHVTAVERLVSQLEETNQNFTEFWLKHEKKLAQCLQLRQFEEDFKILHSAVLDHVDMISKMTDSGDTMQQVHSLYSELQQFEENKQADVDNAETLCENGRSLMEADHYAVDCIRPKCMELQRVCAQYRELMRKRRELLQQSEELHERIEKAKSWCDSGIGLLATQQLDRFNTSDGAQNALSDLDEFLSTSTSCSLGDMNKIEEKYEPVMSPSQRVTIQETLKKIENVHDLCEKRRNSLQRLIHKPKQTVVVQPQKHTPVVDRTKTTNKTAISKIGHMTSDTDKQGHVIRELIDTERTYVSELECILRGYKQEMEMRQSQLPVTLQGQGDILFGNLEEIFHFHSSMFMKELESCSLDPTSVGRCFVTQSRVFSMYSEYCKNKPASDALISEVSDTNLFLKECQNKLGHKLPLSAYLLKPVQRITKYQLLLKEMYKATSDISHQKELQEAISAMVTMLTYVNDVMHSTAIMGYPGRLSQLGKLILQGSFSISYENKKDKTIIKDQFSRLKAQQRQVFVYDNYVVFCKKREENSRHGSCPRAGYMYKSEMETSVMGLTESVRGDRKKFELWKGQRTEVYTLTASSVETKELWVAEVKKLLQVQFDKIKQRSQRAVATVPIKKILTHSPSVSSPTTKVSPTDSFTDNNNEEEEIVRASSQPVSMATRDTQGNLATENSYDDTSWSESDDFIALESIQSGYKYYTVLADYIAMGTTEITMRESDIVEVLQVGHQGWWFVRHLTTEVEGWVPASYLESAKRRSTISSNSLNSIQSSHSLHTSQSSGSFGKEMSPATDV